ncbi:MAG: ABC transporter substrate-binding protein [Actinomycetota bacterium]
MRKAFLGLVLLTTLAAACASESSEPIASGTDTGSPTSTVPVDPCAVEALPLYAAGTLTIATGNPAYSPWYAGKETAEGAGEWESSGFTGDPYTGEGYESAFAYALAEEMGLAGEVSWVAIPFAKSFAPGAKEFDFAMQQISITDKRAENVDFSAGYFDVNQALIANEGSAAIGATTLADLTDLRLGAPVGTTSFQAIEELVQPTDGGHAYDDLDLAIKDLKNGQLDGVVVDFPTAFYGYADVVVGQFPAVGGVQEQFGLTFSKGSPLVDCVNQAIESMRAAGTLDALKNEWLEVDTSVPTFT